MPPRRQADGTLLPGDVIYEFQQVGAYVRVTAIDVDSLTEVVTQGPLSAGETLLKKTAYDKLVYVLNRDRPEVTTDRGRGSRGIVV